MPFFMLCCYLDCHDLGVVEISPSAVAPVCQVGDQLELRCTTTMGMNHRWKFTVFPENITHTSYVTSFGMSGTPPSISDYQHLHDHFLKTLWSKQLATGI